MARTVGGTPGLDRSMRLLIVAVVPATFLASMDLTIVNVAIDSLGTHLHTSLASIQWVVTSYALAMAAALPVSAWLARRYGAKAIFVFALCLFTVGSALCGAAWSAESLILFRVVQGVGAGLMMPVGQMIVARAAGPGRMGKVMATLTSVNVISPIIGPAIGGYIVQDISWRWVFLINLPLGVAAVALAVALLAHGESEPAGSLDVVGLLLLGLGLPVLTYGLAKLGEGVSPASLGGLPTVAAGAALIAAFVVHALRTPSPLLQLRIFANAEFANASLLYVILCAAVFGPYILLPLFYQDVQMRGSGVAGLLFAPQGIGAACTILLARRVIDRVGGGVLALAGAILMPLSTIPFLFVSVSTPAWVFAAVLWFRGLGLGLTLVSATVAALAALRREEIADATPQLNVCQRIGQSIGVALLAAILASKTHGLTGHASLGGAQALGAFRTTFWWMLVLNVIVVPPAFTLARLQRRRHLVAPLAAASESAIA